MYFQFYIVGLLTAAAVVVTAGVAGVTGESHTVTFQNNCAMSGTPQLVQNGQILSSGEPYTSNGPLSAAVAYLQIGRCGLNGEECTTVELTLENPTSSADIPLVSPHSFTVETGFTYNNGCSNGSDCTNIDCPIDFQQPVQCEANNAGLVINFC